MCRAFKPESEKVLWAPDPDGSMFRAWCEGKTGYPIVDAGMRQLNEIGWMHNRVRMCVAMFLSKDLLLNWRKVGGIFFVSFCIPFLGERIYWFLPLDVPVIHATNATNTHQQFYSILLF